MVDVVDTEQIIHWCKIHNWSEPRKLKSGIWVAFPPQGVIETPIPNQKKFARNFIKSKQLFDITTVFNLLLLLLCVLSVVFATVLITPCFLAGGSKK